LAFFLGSQGCAVLHVPRTDQPDTEPPPDAPPAYTPYGEVFPTGGSVGSKTFPRWPVDLTALAPRTPAEEEDLGLVVDRHAVRREFFFTASTARKALGDKPLPNFWHSAHHFAALLRAAAEKLETLRASRARYGATAEALTAFDRGRPAFLAFVAEGERWADGRAPWEEMAPAEVDHLRSLFARAKGEYRDYARPWMPYSFDNIETVTLRALATADDRAWAKLPAPIQELLDRGYQLPTGSWHQMFGHGIDIQGHAVDAHAEDHLLLQLVYDDLMEWVFGDIGAYQFWISPTDLYRRQWSAAQVTFECH
jgi:hypothetical protein